MEHFDAEQYLALDRALPASPTPRSCRRCSCACSSCPTTCAPRYDVSSLQCVIHAAAPCPVPVKQQMIEWFGPVHPRVLRRAPRATASCTATASSGWPTRAPSARRSAARCTSSARTARRCPTGESGTIYFEGGAQFEYHNDAEKTKSSRHPKGWSTLGDVGYLDDDGFLYLTDRKAYMIISGGVNIYPQEAENVLVTHPKVVDVAVFGVPNDDFGEEVKAVVQPVEMPADAAAADALAKELIAFCRSQLADVKCPRSIDFRAELPRHPTGKLYKRHLKDEYWAAAGRASEL